MDNVHPSLVNLADQFKGDIDGLGQDICEQIKLDLDSRQEWDTMNSQWLRLYFQKDEPKNRPWNGSSAESMPLVTEACNQFHARAFQAMFPNRNIIRAVPTGRVQPKDIERSKRVEQHMAWQLLVQDKNYKRNKDRLLLSTPLHGSCFVKTYFDPIRSRNMNVNVRCQDLIVPYGSGPRDIEDLDRKAHRLYLPMGQCKYLRSEGYFSETPGVWSEREKTEEENTEDDVQGMSSPGYGMSDYAMVYEHYCFLDLDGDGMDEPYIVTVDAETEQVVRLAIGWEVDNEGNPIGSWYNAKAPIEHFTHYTFLENPDGFYGLGMGHLIGEINIAVNKLLRQTIDAGTLANAGNMSGFISKQLAHNKGETELSLGKFIPTEGNVEDIRKGIYQFQFPGPNQSLPEIMAALMSRSDRLATVTEAVTGQTDKVMQPTTVMSLIEQALQVFSTVYERVLNAWGQELQKNYDLNRRYMREKEYFAVLDMDGSLQENEIYRNDYDADLELIPIADPKMSTDQQKLARAEAEWAFLVSNPLVQQSPTHLRNASKRYLEAIGAQNIDEILPKVEQPQQEDDPMVEDMMLISMSVIPDAAPGQDHAAHIEAHSNLMNDPDYAPHLSELQLGSLKQHIQNHIGLMYAEMEGGQAGLDGGPAGPEVPEGAGGAVSDGGGLEVMQPGAPVEAPGPTGTQRLDSGVV